MVTIQIEEPKVVGSIYVPIGTGIILTSDKNIIVMPTNDYVDSEQILADVKILKEKGAITCVRIEHKFYNEYVFYTKPEKHFYQYNDIDNAIHALEIIKRGKNK